MIDDPVIMPYVGEVNGDADSIEGFPSRVVKVSECARNDNPVRLVTQVLVCSGCPACSCVLLCVAHALIFRIAAMSSQKLLLEAEATAAASTS